MKSLVKLFVFATVMSPSGVALADGQSMKAECYARSNLLYALATEHGEKLDQTRHVGSNGLLEAFKSPTEGTWTIVYSNDDKLSCVLATGDGLQTDDDDDEPEVTEFTI